jgi:hypothetical protein
MSHLDLGGLKHHVAATGTLDEVAGWDSMTIPSPG